jgi:hypothetical protein
MAKKVLVFILMGLILIFSALFLDSSQRHPRMMRHTKYGMWMVEKNLFFPEMLLKLKEKIGLSAQQVTQIETMKEKFTEAYIKEEADIKVQELKFKSLISKDKINRSKMEKMVRDLAKLKTDLLINRVNYLLDIKDILTPEQISKVEEIKKKFREEMWKKRSYRYKDKVKRHNKYE